MAWTLGFPVVAAWTLAAGIQPVLDDDASETDVAEETETADAASAEADVGWEAANLESATVEETEMETETEVDTETSTASISAGPAANDDLEPIGPAPADSGGIDGFEGRLGVGAIRTLAGLNGINVRYFVTDKLAIGGSAGVALFTYREDDPESTDPACPDPACRLEETRTVAVMAFNLEALYFLRIGREAGALPFRADFGLGGRFGVMTSANATDVEDNLDDPTEFHVEVPLVFQLMFGNNFALSPELGMDFRIVPGSREEGDSNTGFGGNSIGFGTDGPGFGWSLTSGIGLFGGASMHYWF